MNESVCPADAAWAFHPAIAALSLGQRETIVRAVLDQLRRKLAISCRCLRETTQQQIRHRSIPSTRVVPGAGGHANSAVPPPVNAFFQRFYREAAGALSAFEAREHTAQVVETRQRELVPLLLGLYWLLPHTKVSRREKLEWVAIEEPEMGLHPSTIAVVILLALELLQTATRCMSLPIPRMSWILSGP